MRPLLGWIAEFAEPEPLCQAVQSARQAGYARMRAYTPFPVENLAELLGMRADPVARVTLIGGILGGLTGFLMQWYANVVDYPINIGSRPLNSWPSFVPVTFELTVLGASLFAVFGMLAMNRLPRLHHPVFGVPGFERASKDRFYLWIESSDPRSDPAKTPVSLTSWGALSVQEVRDED